MSITSFSLIAFTMMMQSAAGLVLVSELGQYKFAGKEEQPLARCLPVALILGVLGLGIAFYHLASPLAAFYVILNVGSSPLSREIMLVVSFIALMAIVFLIRRKNPESGATILGGVTAIVGLLMVWSIAEVYTRQTIPTFNTAGTDLSFFGTTLLVGSVLGAVLYGTSAGSLATQGSKLPELFMVVAAVGLGLAYVGAPLSIVARTAVDNYGVSGLSPLVVSGQWPVVFVLGLLLTAAGLVFCMLAGLKAIKSNQAASITRFSVLALVLVVIGEVIGRYAFYESFLRAGI